MTYEEIALGVRAAMSGRGVAGTWHTRQDKERTKLHYWAEVLDDGRVEVMYDSLSLNCTIHDILHPESVRYYARLPGMPYRQILDRIEHLLPPRRVSAYAPPLRFLRGER